MTQTRRTCLFCGETAKTSDEHIIAKWIGRMFRERFGPDVKVGFRHQWEHPELGIPSRDKRARLPAFRTRAFCEGCNGGWMGRLEERVKPILEPLILGMPTTLSINEQQMLAFWATKTVLAFQSIEHELTAWARPEDYANVFRRQAPLACSQLWLGVTSPLPAVHYRAHRYPVPMRGRNSEDIHGFGATLAVGHAVFYILVGYAGRVGMRLRYDAAFALKQIWPSTRSELEWPPRRGLSEDEIGDLPNYLVNNSVIVLESN
jgi:hypothetical protein